VEKKKFTTDFMAQFKGIQPKLKEYQKQFKARRSKILKDPFEMPDAPKVVESGIAIHGKKELQTIDIALRFDENDIAKYDDLNETIKPEFLNRCQSKEFCDNFLSWISLEMRFLHVCDALPTHAQKAIELTGTTGKASALSAGVEGDDEDGDVAGGGGEGGGDGGVGEGGDGGLPKSLSRSADVHDFLYWNVLKLEGIPFQDMGYGAPADTMEARSFHAACILFFYNDKLTKVHPEVSNALHAAWQLQFKRVMKAEDLKRPPLDYSAEEQNWCSSTIEYFELHLTDDERLARELPARQRTRSKAIACSARMPPPVQPPANDVDDDDEIGRGAPRLSHQLCKHNQYILHNQHILHNQQHIFVIILKIHVRNIISMFSGPGAEPSGVVFKKQEPPSARRWGVRVRANSHRRPVLKLTQGVQIR
jgi:hypothetical protein